MERMRPGKESRLRILVPLAIGGLCCLAALGAYGVDLWLRDEVQGPGWVAGLWAGTAALATAVAGLFLGISLCARTGVGSLYGKTEVKLTPAQPPRPSAPEEPRRAEGQEPAGGKPGNGGWKVSLPLDPGMDEYLAKVEKVLIVRALRQSGGVRVRAAELLGIKERSLWHRLRKYRIKPDQLNG